MKNSRAVFQELVDRVTLHESPDEIRSLIWILMEHVLEISKNDILAGKVVSIKPETEQRLNAYLERINRSEPVQYVVGEAFFYGRKFQVNPSVLIPRPETEELIRTVMNWRYSNARKENLSSPKMLDIGTGSGCIPVTLSMEWPDADIYASDISTAALSVGVGNAEMYGSNIKFIEHDILNERIPIRDLDVIVSNPPYVTLTEKREMARNVLEFEPHLALFVPEDDPLLFYREIASKSKDVLKTGGLLAVEINEKFGNDVRGLFIANGFSDVDIVTDIAGKQRVVRGIQPARH